MSRSHRCAASRRARRWRSGPRAGVVGDESEGQHPPAGVGDDPGQRVDGGQRSGLGAQPARGGLLRVRVVGNGSTGCRCRRRSAACPAADATPAGPDPAAALMTSSRVLAVSRSSDRQAAGVHQGDAGHVDLGRGELAGDGVDRARETRRPSGRLGHLAADATRPSRCRRRSSSASAARSAVRTAPTPADGRRRVPARRSPSPGRRRGPMASARPASRAGVVERRDSKVVGWIRPASTITAWIGAMSPPAMSPGSQPGAISGPVNSESSTCTAVGGDTALANLVGEVADAGGAPDTRSPRRAGPPTGRVAAADEHHHARHGGSGRRRRRWW